VELVVNNAPDIEIWRAMFDLVALTKHETINATDRLRSSSASQRGIEQTHDEVDLRILEELKGRVYYDVGGFCERYFKGKSWINNARDIYEESRAHYTEGRWSGWPEPSIQSLFFF
jgi:hypothetical protein